MIYQYWLHNAQWDKDDPKLRQLRESSIQLSHTSRLVESIALDPPGILLIRGPRQSGKSTFLRQFAQKVIAGKVLPENLALIDAERCDTWQELLSTIEAFLKQLQAQRSVVLIDEITSVDRWWKAIKIAADDGLTRTTLLLGTGSNTMDLVAGADLLPGRRGRRHPVDFELLPVRYKDVAGALSLRDYFLTGGMPWAIDEFLCHGFIPSYVYELYASWIKGALIHNRHNTALLQPLLTYIARRSGTPLSVTSLARDCGIGSNSTAEAVLGVLESNFVLLVAGWREPGSLHTAPRKNRKFFAFDHFLFHVFNDFGKGWESTWDIAQGVIENPEKTGLLVENLVASELRHRTGMHPLAYFLGRKEIDFIGDQCVEVKYQQHVSLAEFEWVKKVLPASMPFTVITKQTRARDGKIRLVPLEDWLLE
jgi:hypothetical protein